jgi:hypothetical protein
MLPNRKKSNKNMLAGKKSVKADKTEQEEEEEMEAMRLDLENEQKRAEGVQGITKELEKRSYVSFFEQSSTVESTCNPSTPRKWNRFIAMVCIRNIPS